MEQLPINICFETLLFPSSPICSNFQFSIDSSSGRVRAVDRHCHKMRPKNKCGARFFHLAKVRGDNFLSSNLNSTY